LKPVARLAQAAVVGIGVHGQGLAGSGAFLDRLFRNREGSQAEDRAPGLLALAAADEAHAGAGSWDPARSAVFLGLESAPGTGLGPLARKLQARFGFRGQGGACVGEDLGANLALSAAVRRIQAGGLDGALVGAIQAWPAGRTQPASAPGGLAVFLALRRKDAADRDGDHIWAVMGSGPERDRKSIRFDPAALFPGLGQMVSGLLQVAAGCMMAGHGAWLSPEDDRWEPFLDRNDGLGFMLEVEAPGGRRLRTDLWRPFRPGPAPKPLLAAPEISAYAGDSLDDLIQRVLLDEPGGQGPVRLAVVAHGELERQQVLDRIPGLIQRNGAAEPWLDPQACFCPAPVRGKVACLFTVCGLGYPGMGRELLLGMPCLPMLIRAYQDFAPADWAYGAHPGRSGDPLYERAASRFLCQAHAAFTRDLLGLWPDLAMGLSLGETEALVAYGAWGCSEGEQELPKPRGLSARQVSGTFEAARIHWGLPEGAEVRWRNWMVFGPVGKVLERVAGEERAYVSIIFSPVHCLLAGQAEACRRVLAGCAGITAFPTGGLVEHTPVMTAVPPLWYLQHRRPTRPVPGMTFFSQYLGDSYELSDDRVAEALAGQALHPLDFPTAAWRAWDNGVRVFIEHGPRNVLTSALARLLPRQEGVFLSLDAQGEDSLQRAVKVAAELWCRGVPVDLERMQATLRGRPIRQPKDPRLAVAASLFAASLERTGTLDGAYQACLRETHGRFLEFLGLPGDEGF
jgi:malonyl CoA-acyl carrier protein transacylase